MAEDMRASGQLESGIELVEQFVRNHTPTPSLLFVLGNILYDKGDLDRAQLAYEQILRIQPSHCSALNNLAVVYKAQGKIGSFARTYRKAMAASRSQDNPAIGRLSPALARGTRLLLRCGLPLAAMLLVLWWVSGRN